MKKLFTFLTLALCAVGAKAADTDVVSWKVGATGPAVGTAFQVANASAEDVLQVAFGAMDASKTDNDATNYTTGSASVTISYGGKSYAFDKYASTSQTNGNAKSDLKADGTSTGNYMAFVPKYTGTIIVVTQNNGGKVTYCFEDGTEKSGTLIGTGTGTTAYDGKSDLKVLNGGSNYSGGIKLTVKAGSTYTISVTGSKGRWMGVIYEYDKPSGKEASTFALTSDAAVTLWKGKTADITYTNNAGAVSFVSTNASVATVSASGVITAVSEGVTTVTVKDAGSDEVDGAVKEVTVTVQEHKNTTTTNVTAVAAGTEGVISNAQHASDNKSATLDGVATVYDFGGSTGIQAGSTQTFSVGGQKGLTGLKLSGSRRIGIKPAAGVTISKVTCYVRSNGSATTFSKYYDASGSAKDLTTAIDVPDKDATDPKEIDLTDYYVNGFRFEAQTQAVFVIEYSRVKQMGVTIKETGYATLYTDYAVAIPSGVKAYYGELNDDKDKVLMTEITGIIPASTAVILNTDAPDTYNFVEASDVAAIADNVLEGTLTDKVVAANSVWTLGLNSEDEVGLRQYSGTSVRAYSAYVSSLSAAPFLTLDFGTTTAIGEAKANVTEKGGVRKYVKNGRLVIENAKGTFNVAGAQMK